MKNQYSVILVYATSYALRVEKILKGVGVSSKLIPVPRHLSSDCGVCVRINRTDKETARQALVTGQVKTEGIHDI
ncbi:MAG: DUF3343 domain-containing protein [Anaerolineae bacterium]|nr:DUF3343 domain-containing protein [Anaerolineae bacterium]